LCFLDRERFHALILSLRAQANKSPRTRYDAGRLLELRFTDELTERLGLPIV